MAKIDREDYKKILRTYGINPERLAKKIAGENQKKTNAEAKKVALEAKKQEEHNQMLKDVLDNNPCFYDDAPATYEKVSEMEYQNVCDLLKMRYDILSCKSFSKSYIEEVKAEIRVYEALKKKIETKDAVIVNAYVLKKGKKEC